MAAGNLLRLRTHDAPAVPATVKPHVLILGANVDVLAMFERLLDTPYVFTVAGEGSDATIGLTRQPDLILAVLPRGVAVDRVASGTPWIAWNRRNDPALAMTAYEAGARAVLPGDVTPAALLSVLRSTLEGRRTRVTRGHLGTGRRQYPRGTRIRLADDEVLRVVTGVIAQRVIHRDGTDVLIGLFGANQLLVGHPDDSCCLDLIAHDDTLAVVQPWSEAAQVDGFATSLRERLRHLEAWAAVQAQAHLSARIVGLLSLLADQFGRRYANALVIDVRLTHGQLAAATGTTRATVTRVLGALKRRGLAWTAGAGPAQRFCLRDPDIDRHTCGRSSEWP
jgi:hypothetical protein